MCLVYPPLCIQYQVGEFCAIVNVGRTPRGTQQVHVGPPGKGREAPKSCAMRSRLSRCQSISKVETADGFAFFLQDKACKNQNRVGQSTPRTTFTGRLSFKVVLGKARDLSAQVKGEVFRCRRPEHLAVTCLRATVPGASPFSGLYGPLSPRG